MTPEHLRTISNEDRALLLSLHPQFTETDAHALRNCLNDFDWDYFSRIVQLSGVTGLIHSRFHEFSIAIPGDVLRSWMAWRISVEQDNANRLELAKDILAAAEEKNLPLVPIKGMALFLNQSIKDLSIRSTCDIDLVTLPEHIEAVENILLQKGYVASDQQDAFIRHHHHRVYFKPGQVDTTTVELHWTFLYKTFGLLKHDKMLMAQTQTNSQGLRLLDPHDNLLSLLLHLAQHRFRGQLKWLLDIQVAASRADIDIDRLRSRARQLGVLSAAEYGLWLANHLLGNHTLTSTTLRIKSLARLSPPLTMLRNPHEPEAWKRPIIDILLHDRIERGVARAFYRTSKVLEDKYSLKLPNWMILNK